MNYILWGLFGPSTWPLWLLVLAAALLIGGTPGRRRLQLARLAAGAGALLFVVLGLLPTGAWLAMRLESATAPPTRAQLERVGHIVVLAGSENLVQSAARGSLELSAAGERVVDGAALAVQLSQARLWIVGGVRINSPHPDVAWTADAWRRLGIAPARIAAVDGTTDTCANAQGVARLRLDRPILLVTSAWHMPRALACFRRAGLTPLPYPVDYLVGPNRTLWQATSMNVFRNLRCADLALHEQIGLVWYRLTGRI